MITVRDVESFLYTWAPASLAASWDNVGLLVGDPVREVKKKFSQPWILPSPWWRRPCKPGPISSFRIIR